MFLATNENAFPLCLPHSVNDEVNCQHHLIDQCFVVRLRLYSFILSICLNHCNRLATMKAFQMVTVLKRASQHKNTAIRSFKYFSTENVTAPVIPDIVPEVKIY